MRCVIEDVDLQGMVHIEEECVHQCRQNGNLCSACRHATGFEEAVEASIIQQRLRNEHKCEGDGFQRRGVNLPVSLFRQVFCREPYPLLQQTKKRNAANR